MNWTTDRQNNYCSNIIINDKIINFEVTEDGHYRTIVTFTDKEGKSISELYNSGFRASRRESIKYLESQVNFFISENECQNVIEDHKVEKEPEIIEVVEDVIPCVLEGGTVDFKEFEIKETKSIEDSDTISINKKENEDGTLTVELSSVKGAVIKYTTNGREVIVSSKIYKEPFVVNKGVTLNATAFINKEPVSALVNVTLY